MWLSFVLPRVLIVAALASVSMMPASAGIIGATKVLPAVQMAAVQSATN